MADLLTPMSPTSAQPPVVPANISGLGLQPNEVQHLIQESMAWAASHGMLVQSKGSTTYNHIPFCLLPVKIPSREFEKGVELSPLFAKLVDRVSRDPDWLHARLSSVLEEDSFTRRLVEISKLVQKEGVLQTASLGIHRSDYMLHDNPKDSEKPKILQVELNTISSSFGCLSSLTSQLHRYILDRHSSHVANMQIWFNSKTLQLHLPQNDAIDNIPLGIAKAHLHYNVANSVVVFVVQPNESNSIDQRWIEYKLYEKYQIKVLRKTLAEMAKAELRTDKRRLFIDNVEVSVAYFRSAYTPNDYPSETEWIGRTIIERSYAIKCPNITYHLAGTKKVQQVLADPVELRNFLSDEDSTIVEECFTNLYGLEKNNPKLNDVKAMVANDLNGFVLKPQREGGGNNMYGPEVNKAIQKMSPTELESYILMSRIHPKESEAVLVRNATPLVGNTISELGMFSIALFDTQKEILNIHGGHLLRTKFSNTDEGGVAAGFAVLSSPFLTPKK